MPPKSHKEYIAQLKEQIKQTAIDRDNWWEIECQRRIKIAIRGKLEAENKEWKNEIKEKYRSMNQTVSARANRSVKTKSKELATKMVDSTFINRSKYMDGVMAYPIIHLWAKKVKITRLEMIYLILLNIVGKLSAPQSVKYGLGSYKTCLITLTTMVDDGMADRVYQNNKAYFIPSPLGIKIFKGFKEFYEITIKEKIGTDEYKRIARKWKG